MAEFSIIERYCQGIGAQHSTTKIAVGDDAAVVSVPNGMELAVSLDTMVEGVHFYPNTPAELIADKLLAVNLSDMAAMGAEPRWATLGLTVPTVDEDWFSRFSSRLNQSAEQFNVQLIGGDTTQGPLTLSLNIMGLLPKGKGLTRAGAKPEDDIYVSNRIGDAALALQCLESNVDSHGLNLETIKTALDLPEPQIKLGQSLLEIASACLDLSDGLVADLGHIAEQSKVSLDINIEQIPLSAEYQQYIKQGGSVDIALTGGDDYQLAFTAEQSHREAIEKLSKQLDTPLTRIGKVTEQAEEKVNLFSNSKPYQLTNNLGYEHFKI